MKTSAKGIQFIYDREVDPWERKSGTFKAYLDTVANPPVWTIGIGHTAAAGPPAVYSGMVISHNEGLSILANDLGAVETRVNKAFGRAVPQNVFDAAVSFDFNTGGIFRATWVQKYLMFGVTNETEAWFMQWDKPAAIIGRRRMEWKALATGDYSPVNDGAFVPPVSTTVEPTVTPPIPRPRPAPIPVTPAPVEPARHPILDFIRAILRALGVLK